MLVDVGGDNRLNVNLDVVVARLEHGITDGGCDDGGLLLPLPCISCGIDITVLGLLLTLVVLLVDDV